VSPDFFLIDLAKIRISSLEISRKVNLPLAYPIGISMGETWTLIINGDPTMDLVWRKANLFQTTAVCRQCRGNHASFEVHRRRSQPLLTRVEWPPRPTPILQPMGP
jgi:hypothetical protein